MSGSGSGKTKVLINLINHQPDIDEIFFYAKEPYETKYQLLKLKSKVFAEYSNNMKVLKCSNDKIFIQFFQILMIAV